MATFGLTPEGLKIKRLADIIVDLENDARETYGTSVDLDPRRPLGQFIGIQSERLSLVWELIEQVYNAGYTRHATGKQLDELVAINGLIRRPATFSRVPVTVYGTFNKVIPKGSRASVLGSPESIFATEAAITIGVGTNEIQKLTFLSAPVDGSFTLVIDGEATFAIPFDVDDLTLEVLIEDLTNVDIVNVSGNFTTGFTIEFANDSGQQPWPLITVGSNTLTSRTIHNIVTAADVSGSLMNKCFRFDDIDGAVGVYFDVGNTGAPTPPALEALTYRSIKVSTVNQNDSAATVATKLAATLATDPNILSATVIGSTSVRFEMFDEINLQALVDLNTAFTFTTLNIGRDIGELTITTTQMQAGQLPNGTGFALATVSGPVSAPAGSLSVIEDTLTGWNAIVNPTDAVEGSNIESDADLKARRISQFSKIGRSTPGAIRSKLLEVTGVESATVRYNNKATTIDGIPPKSVKAYVLGGEPEDIGAMLYDSVAAGILTVGDESYEYQDTDGYFHTMSFSRPNLVEVYVKIVVQKLPENLWPSDASAALKAQAVAYGDTLGMGSDVIVYPRLISYLNILQSVIEGMELFVGLAPNPSSSDRIEIDAQDIAVFDTSRVTVVVEDLV